MIAVVIVVVAGPLIVAVHLNGNAPVIAHAPVNVVGTEASWG